MGAILETQRTALRVPYLQCEHCLGRGWLDPRLRGLEIAVVSVGANDAHFPRWNRLVASNEVALELALNANFRRSSGDRVECLLQIITLLHTNHSTDSWRFDRDFWK